jgi:hypothetical protein
MKEPFAAVAIFCATAAYELHKFIGAPRGLPAILALVAIYLLPASIALWTVADAQERGRSTSYDFGSFIFFLWPLLAPIYLFRTRGVRAFGTIGLFFCACFAGIAFAMFMGYPASLQR